MRSKLLVILTAVLLFGLGIVAYAYTSTTTNAETTAAASCCSCCGDSCPMKKAGDKTTGETPHECCCKGDSCPMMSKDGKHGDKMAMAANGERSCPMMSEKKDGMAGHDMKDMKMANGESCPMMKDAKDAKMAEMHKGMAGMDHTAHAKSGDSCSCACCNHNKEKKVTKDTGAI